MKLALFSLFLSTALIATAQEEPQKSPKEFYFSWGYNTEWYTPSDIHVSQPSLDNDYTFHGVAAHDKIGWDKLFSRPLTIPQYSYRLGFFFNKEQDLGIELNFDHTKFVVTQGQTVRVSGTMDGKQVDTNYVLTPGVLKYQLNNGANFFLINLVKRVKLPQLSSNNDWFKTALLMKIGVGPVVPHVQNTIFGNDNKPHFQIGGWNTGFETALRFTIKKHIYLEICEKVDYARYAHLKVYEGQVRQSFFTAEFIANLGVTYPLGKRK